MRPKSLYKNIIVFPDVFLFGHTECIAHSCIRKTCTGDFKHINPEIADIILNLITLAEHKQTSVRQSAFLCNTSFLTKLNKRKLTIWKLWIKSPNSIQIRLKRIAI